MASCVKCHKCPYMTTLNFRLESHLITHSLPRRLFNCANFIESLRCFRCTNFEAGKLVDMKQHFKVGHALPDLEAKIHKCGSCFFQTHSNLVYLKHRLLNMCRKVETETTVPQEVNPLRLEGGSDKNKTKRGVKRRKNGNKRKLKCNQCPFETKVQCALKSHILWKHRLVPDDTKWLHCALCSYTTGTKLFLRKHMNTAHRNKRKVTCDYCEYETESKSNLGLHISYRHTNEVQWFKCQHCWTKCETKSGLERHLNYTHGRIVSSVPACSEAGKK